MTCNANGCTKPAFKKGMCSLHYTRMRKYGTTIDPYPRVKCSVEGCEQTTLSRKGICITHYKQSWYLKNTAKREHLLERTSQERWINMQSGYVMVKHNGVLTYEHRVLAEKALGKPLPPKAIIHHMSTRDDNHGFFKLVICPDQEYHLLLHKRMEELGYEGHKDA